MLFMRSDCRWPNFRLRVGFSCCMKLFFYLLLLMLNKVYF